MEKNHLSIDGSYGEGGGQILRTALFLSLITKKPFKMYNIRRGRKKPGLKPQHLHIVKTLEVLTSSKAVGASPGSLEISFYPGEIRGGSITVDFKTAGSITLFLQTLLPVIFFAQRRTTLRVRGGTDVPMSMTWDYFEKVFLPLVKGYAEKVNTKVIRRGYYPKGGGEVEIEVTPRYRFKENGNFVTSLRESSDRIDLVEDSPIKEIRIFSVASIHLKNRKVSERQLDGASEVLKGKVRAPIRGKTSYEPSLSPGSSILIFGIREKACLGADGIGKLGKRAEDVGREAALFFLKELEKGAPIDSHLSDNLVPWLALFGGRIRIPGKTKHFETNIWITEKFLGKTFRIRDEGNTLLVETLF